MVRLTKAVVNSTSLPVTVKTRLGWDMHTINIDEVAERLQDAGIKALTIHARTRAQMYKGEADWDHISRIKNQPEYRNFLFLETATSIPPEKCLGIPPEIRLRRHYDRARRDWLPLDF